MFYQNVTFSGEGYLVQTHFRQPRPNKRTHLVQSSQNEKFGKNIPHSGRRGKKKENFKKRDFFAEKHIKNGEFQYAIFMIFALAGGIIFMLTTFLG